MDDVREQASANTHRPTTAHMIQQVRAKDRGNMRWFELSEEREQLVRDFLKGKYDKAV